MPQVELPAGTVEYEDSGPPPGASAGAPAPVVVLLHGLLMSGTVWRDVAPQLARECRVVAPTLPLGGHRIPMRPGADLTLDGQARLVADFLDALDLRDVTLVVHDWGGPLLLVELGRTERIGRLALVACEAFDNFPPGFVKPLAALLRPLGAPGIRLLAAPLAIHRLRRLPLLFGWMSRRPVPREVMDGWFGPVNADPAIRRDLRAYVGPRLDRARLVAATERLRELDRPALVVWATEDKLMPRDHGRRLADLLPQGRLVELDGSRTLVPIDRPDALASALRGFLAETGALPAAAAS